MKIDKYKLYYKTQSKTFLLTMVFVVIFIFLIASTIVNSTKSELLYTKSIFDNLNLLQIIDLNTNSYQEELGKALSNPQLSIEELLNFIENISYIDNVKIVEITISQLEKYQAINSSYPAMSLFLKVQINNEKLIELLDYSKQNTSTKYTYRLISFYYMVKKDIPQALDAIKLETTLYESEVCKDRLVSCLIQLKKIDELELLEKNPAFESQKDDISKAILLEKKTWALLFKAILKSQFNPTINGIFFLTILTGLVWFTIWLHALRPEGLLSATILSLFAFGLGIFSTSLTIFIIYIEEDLFHMSEGISLIQGFLYFILGVGLREEFSKILVFTVLIPILLKRKNALEWLIIPGMVGLGFAVEENLNYFLVSDGTALPGRFLTANFFHVALTAIAGESLCHYFFTRSRGPEHVISTFSMVVIMHGLYDAFIAVKALQQLNFVTSLVFIYSLFLFFGRLKDLRPNNREPISLTTHFILGISILFMSAFIYVSYGGGHFHAFQVLMPAILDLLITIYMFLYFMPNSIIKVF